MPQKNRINHARVRDLTSVLLSLASGALTSWLGVPPHDLGVVAAPVLMDLRAKLQEHMERNRRI